MIPRIGKYTVEAELGRGGFGQVYKAFDPDVKQYVAIKVLLAEGDPDLLKRFQLEVVTTASLHHKNIVTIYASGEEGGTPYLVMELLEGQTLAQILKKQLDLPLLEKVRIINQVAEGLAYAHGRGIVHRDVKPANIMLLADGCVKIMDFGIALASNRTTATVTMEGFVVGTVPYMAPEQFTSDAKASEQTDIYSFGVVCYELLTFRHPYEANLRDLSGLRMAILTQEAPNVGRFVPGCPEALEILIHRTLAKDPEFRYQKFEEIRLDTASILVDLQHDQAASILADVPPLIAKGDLPAARARVREAQKLEPGNRTARQLLETIDQKLQEKLNRERAAARLTEAERHLADRRYAEAVQTLETAARLDTTNVMVQMRLADAKGKLDGSVKANRLVEEARVRQQKGELEEALDRVRRALEVDPDHTEASRLMPRITEQLERRQRDRARQEVFQAATDHMSAKRFADAIKVLDDFERARPGAPGVAELRSRIDLERVEEERRVRAERFQLALAKTRETIQAGDLQRAGQMVDFLTSKFADEPGAAEVLPILRERLNALQRKRDIDRCREKANELVEQESYEAASDFLTKATARFPDDAVLAQQRSSITAMYDAHKRSEGITAARKRAQSLRSAGNLRGALSTIEEAKQNFGPDAGLDAHARELEVEIEQQKYEAGLTNLLEVGRGLMAARKYSELLTRIARAPEYAGEADVLALLDAARAAAGEEDERNLSAAALSNAEAQRQRGEWKQAMSTLEGALLRYPHNLDLSRALEHLRSGFERQQRAAAIERHRAVIQQQMQDRSWSDAEQALRRARAEFPDDPAFDALSVQVELGVREENVKQAVAQVRDRLAVNDLPEALRKLEETRSVFSHDAQWRAIEQEVARRRAYEEGLAEAERKRHEGNLEEAESLAGRLLTSAFDKRAEECLRAIREQRTHSETVRAKVRDLLVRYDIRQAVATLNAARTEVQEEGLWDTLQVEIEVRQDELRRQASIADQIRADLKQDEIRRAEAKLAEGRSLFDNPVLWNNLQGEIDARKAFLVEQITAQREREKHAQEQDRQARESGARHQEQVAAIAQAVRDSLKRENLREAAAQLRAGRKQYPDESLWPVLQNEIEQKQALLSTQKRIAAIADSVRERMERNDLVRAASELVKASKDHPEEPIWHQLQEEIDQRHRHGSRPRPMTSQIPDLASSIRAHLERDDLRQAAAELGAAGIKERDEKLWSTLKSEIETRQFLLQRRDYVAAISQRVRERLAKGAVKQAAAELSAARVKYPDDQAWSALEAEILSKS